MRRLCLAAVAALWASACAQPTSEMRVIGEAAKALGGRGRVESLAALAFDGRGTQADAGQGATADGAVPMFDRTDLRLTIGLEQPRYRLTQTRTANFPYPLPTVQTQHLALDGDVAFDVGPAGTPSRSSAAAARDRRLDRLHHPVSIVRAALEEGARLGKLRTHEGKQVVEVTTASGDTLTLAVDGTTHLPASVTSQRYDINLGDVARETTFSDYQDVDGLTLPMRLTTTVDGRDHDDVRVTRYNAGPDIASLAAPGAVRSAKAPPMMADPVIDVTPIGDGAWLLGGQSHHSVLIAFADHTVLIDVPQHEVRTMAVIAKAREVVDNKPLMKAIVTHHHFDHVGGIRAAVSEGLTLVAHESIKDDLTRLIKRQHTIYKDAASQNPRTPEIETVGDRLTMKDGAQTVELFHADTAHARSMLAAYLPKSRVLVQADLYATTFAAQPFLPDLLRLIDGRKLRVATHVPLHGGVQSEAEFLKAVESRRSSN